MISPTFIKEVGLLKWLWRTIIRQIYKRILKRDSQLILPNGLPIQLPRLNNFASEVFVTKADVDWGTEAFFIENFKKGIFLDVGAHIGYYSLLLADKASTVYSFEPDPRNIEYLRNNITSCNNITIVQKAVSSTNGDSSFSLASSSANSSLEYHTAGQSIINVETITIDTFRHHVGEISGIKTDVEGHDFNALLGARSTLLSDKPLVITEAVYDDSLSQFLKDINYVCYAFTRHNKTRKIKFQRIPASNVWVTKMLILVHHDNIDSIDHYLFDR